MMVYERRAYVKLILFFSVFAVYNAALSLKFGSFEQYFDMSFHYFIISNLLFFVVYLMGSPWGGRQRLLSTIKLGCYAFLGMTILQIIFGFHLPNVDIYENGEYSSFFRIANDMSLALAAVVPILFLMKYEGKMSTWKAFSIIAVIFFICLNNHTKTALGAIVLYCILFFMMAFRIRVSFSLAAIVLLVVIGQNINVKISYQEYTIGELIVDPIKNLLLLQSYNDLGSIETRVNASIIGIKALFNSYFLGIGYGNSVTLLAMPGNQLVFAKSLHNDTLAFILEEGLLAVFIYGYGIRKAIAMSKDTKNYLSKVRLCCFYSFPVAILSSSGVTSNYFFLICLFTLIFINPVDFDQCEELAEFDEK